VGAFSAALVDSRSRWRDLALLASDLAFETDSAGRFVLLGPEDAFGWSTRTLIGLAAETLLLRPDGVSGFNPFLPHAPVRRHRVWLRRADGRAASVLISSSPMFGPDGGLAGARGTIQDNTEQDRREDRLADSLLQHRTVREITRRMRRAVLPDMVIKIGLEELLDATGANGALVVACDGASPVPGAGMSSIPGTAPSMPDDAGTPADPAAPRMLPRILHRAGEALQVTDREIVAHVCKAASTTAAPWTRVETQFDRRMILTAVGTHFCEPVVMMLWRDGARPWTSGDAELSAAFLVTLGGVLEHDQVQSELARQSGADTLTGLLNRESFTVEVNRRLDRLDAEGLAATLMVVGLDRFQEINQAHGHESGDDALRQAAHVLRDAVRPTDLVARLGSDVFALWLDGADQFAAAERAEVLCQKGVTVTLGESVQLHVSVGLTTRPSRSYEIIETLLEQAHAALAAIKLAGGGRWHFYNEGIGT
jgi:diguanylate cyclase (GGDEF)-like protein/PAS domain S-box-containing protein